MLKNEIKHVESNMHCPRLLKVISHMTKGLAKYQPTQRDKRIESTCDAYVLIGLGGRSYSIAKSVTRHLLGYNKNQYTGVGGYSIFYYCNHWLAFHQTLSTILAIKWS